MSTLYKRGGTWWIKYYTNGKALYESLKTRSKAVAKREQQAIDAVPPQLEMD